MEDPFKDYRPKPTDTALAELQGKAVEMIEVEEKVVELERLLKEAKEEHRTLQEKVIPELMESAAGMSEFRLSSGFCIKIKEDIYTSTGGKKDPARHDKCMDWLDEHGHSGMVKRRVGVSFTKEREEEARRLAQDLADREYLVEVERNVAPQTLKKFVKERIKEGEEVPLDSFGVVQFKKAIISKG